VYFEYKKEGKRRDDAKTVKNEEVRERKTKYERQTKGVAQR